MAENTKGLAGVSAGETSICTVGKEGKDLRYYGYSIKDMGAASYEEIAYLLLNQKLPNRSQCDEFIARLNELCELPDAVQNALKGIPKGTHPMDVLRSGVSLLGCFYPEERDKAEESVMRILATLPAMLLVWHHHHEGNAYQPAFDGGVAQSFLNGLYGKAADAEDIQMMNTSLILYAEHEFNASTFSARITTSTLSDMYSAVCTAIGTLKGPLHGGANEAAMDMISPLKDKVEAESFIRDALAKKVKVMGFGHRVYKISDPRSDIIKVLTQRLGEKRGDLKYYEISEVIEKVMKEEKGLFPNLDFYSATFYHLLDIPIPHYTPIFVFSRIAGWAAHILEQRSDNRLIRPGAEYTGPEAQAWTAIGDRG